MSNSGPDTDKEESDEQGRLSRRRFLSVAGASAAGLGFGVLNLARPVEGSRPGAPQSGHPLIVGEQNQAAQGDETVLLGSVGPGSTLKVINDSPTGIGLTASNPGGTGLRVEDLLSVKQIVDIDPPHVQRGKGIFIDIEGNEYQRSGIWITTNATVPDTVVGLFVENIGQGDGIYVENTDASSKASGIAIVNRKNSIGLNCRQDSENTFLQVLKDPEHQGLFGDLIAFKDLALMSPPFSRADERALWIGGDGRMRTRVGIGNAEGIQMRRNELVSSGAMFKDVTLEVPEPDLNYGVVATPFWNTSVYVSNKTQTGFRLNFSAGSPGSEVSWIVFRDTL